MITVKERTTIAAISELRNKSGKILGELKQNRIILERHHKPVAVMLDYHTYEAFEEILKFSEDYVLGSTALQRDVGSKKQDFIDIDKW